MGKIERMHFGERVKLYRKMRGWTLSTLSSKSGVSIPTLCTIESGGTFNTSAIRKLEAAFGVALFDVEV